MKATLIIPCWNTETTLARCLSCVRAQTLEDFETVFVDDGSTDGTGRILAAAARDDVRIRVVSCPHRGVSAARNAGLDVTRGEFIFFADPDDAFSPEMLAMGVAAMERDGADYCVFPYREQCEGETEFHLRPLKGSCRYDSNDAIIREHLTRMFGYSAEQVRAWYAGTDLFAHRVQGSVCWCVYRRALIERYHVRFDERIDLYEDAMFNCAYMLHAKRMTCVDEPLYDYIHLRTGAIARLRCGEREFVNKFELLRKRKELDVISGGRLGALYECSCVFSLLEMMKIVLAGRVPFFRGLFQVRTYACDEVVRTALHRFPLSWRHPILAASVLFFRCCTPKPSCPKPRS